MPRGYVDRITPYALEGWVLDDEAPTGRAEVEAFVGGRRLGGAIADIDRQDLRAVGPRAAGFHLPMDPPLLLREEVANLTFTVGGKPWPLKLGLDHPHVLLPFRLAPAYGVAGGHAAGAERIDPDWDGPWPRVRAVPDEGVVDREAGPGEHVFALVAGSAQPRVVDIWVESVRAATAVTLAPPNITAADTRVTGVVDSIGPRFISGWMRPGFGDDGEGYEVVIDGEPAGRGLANRPRPDLTAALGLPDSGLLFPIPQRFRDGREHSVSLHRRSDGERLLSPSERFRIGDHTFVAAWRAGGVTATVERRAGAAEHPASVEVAVAARGREVIRRTLTFAEGEGGTAAGLALFTLDELKSAVGAPLHVSVPALGLAADLPTEGARAALGALDGYLEHCDGRWVTGWCAYSGQQDVPARVELLVDGESAGSFAADQIRADLRIRGYSNFHHGFHIRVPERFLDGREHELVVRDQLLDETVPNSPLEARLAREVRRTRLPGGVLGAITTAEPVNPTTPPAADARPDVTVVILTRNGAEVLRPCLESLWRFVPRDRVQVVVVDHGSSDDTSALMAEMGRRLSLRQVRVEGNNGFSWGNNAAVRAHADTPYVLLLNNDVVLMSDVVTAMRAELERSPDVGLVGCKLLEARDLNDVTTAEVHHAGIQLGPGGDGVIRGHEAGPELLLSELNRTIRPFSVTGACAMMRTEDYRAIGGFHEGYFYGFEDVELGERVRSGLGKDVVCLNGVAALHHRGWLRLTSRGDTMLERVHRNDGVLLRRVGYQMKKRHQRALYSQGLDWSLTKAVIGFVVSDAGPEACASDAVAARGLAAALQAHAGLETVFVDSDAGWYDASGLTALVNTLPDYNIAEVAEAEPYLLRAAWMRGDFERWLEQPLERYDLLFSASRRFVEALASRGFVARHLPLGIDPDAIGRGRADPELATDLAFVGRSGEGARAALAARGGLPKGAQLWGQGWNPAPGGAVARGLLPPRRAADLHASIKLAIEDARPSAAQYGVTGARVMDAVAGGALPLTNAQASSDADWSGLLPVWNTPRDLAGLSKAWLADNAGRSARVEALRAIARERHGWERRAVAFRQGLESRFEVARIAIKVGDPALAPLAAALAAELRAREVRLTIDDLAPPLPGAPPRRADRDHVDAVIVLPGEHACALKPYDLNLLWLVAGADAVSGAELRPYDRVAFGSQALLERWGALDGRALLAPAFAAAPPEATLTDADRKLVDRVSSREVLVVADSNTRRRDALLAAHAATPLLFVGPGWDRYVSAERALGAAPTAAALTELYRRAAAVLIAADPDDLAAGLLPPQYDEVAAAGGRPRLVDGAAAPDRARADPSATAAGILDALSEAHHRRFSGWLPVE